MASLDPILRQPIVNQIPVPHSRTGDRPRTALTVFMDTLITPNTQIRTHLTPTSPRVVA